MDIYVHIGLPKCGSTTFQNTLFQHRQALISKGVIYPEHGIDQHKPYGKNHQALVTALRQDDWISITSFFENIIKEAKQHDCDRLVLSHEGLYNHFYDFEEMWLTTLQRWSQEHTVHIVAITRDIISLFKSYYKQNILNPPHNKDLGFGSTLTPDEFLNLPRIPMFLRYDLVLKKLQNAIPSLVIHRCDLSETVFQSILYDLFDIDLPIANTKLENRGLSEWSIEQVRRHNRLWSFYKDGRAQMIADTRAKDTDVADHEYEGLFSKDLCAKLLKIEHQIIAPRPNRGK